MPGHHYSSSVFGEYRHATSFSIFGYPHAKRPTRLFAGISLVACLIILGFSSTILAYPNFVTISDATLTPLAYLPYVAKNYPPLTPTPFATPVSIHRYQMEYAVHTNESYVWMPAPRYWDGNGVRQITIREIFPNPADHYREENGTEIIYWENTSGVTQTFKVVFDVEIGLIEYGIDESTIWPSYDVNSGLYQKNITVTTWVQVNHPEIQNQALSIVGSETNPYKKARLIHQWMVQNIAYGSGLPDDALSTLRNRRSACGGRANLFVALCRASGVPARNASGIISYYGQTFQSGSWADGTLWFHVWAEFYLPEYGWIQVDPGDANKFARIPDPRLVTSKGNDIHLGHGDPNGELSWFHVPYNTHTQLEQVPLWLTVTQLP